MTKFESYWMNNIIGAIELLTDKKEELEILSKTLLEKEVILKSDVERLIGPRPFEEKTPAQAVSDTIHNLKEEDREEQIVEENQVEKEGELGDQDPIGPSSE